MGLFIITSILGQPCLDINLVLSMVKYTKQLKIGSFGRYLYNVGHVNVMLFRQIENRTP